MQHFDDFAQMQRDAERRVMEMQRRAMAAVDSVEYPDFLSRPKVSDNDTPDMPETNIKHSTEPSPQSHSAEQSNEKSQLPLLERLSLSDEDSESMMLTIIILLLLRENADERLILALLYILL